MSFCVCKTEKQDPVKSNLAHINHIRETGSICDGQLVEFLGRVFTWNSRDCVSEELCRRWRAMSDPTCDDAVNTLFCDTEYIGKDLLEALREHVSVHTETDGATRFWNEISKPPPTSLHASPRDMQLGRELFLDHAIHIAQALLHFSLASGFAGLRIVRTLRTVSFLLPPSVGHNNKPKVAEERSFSRLLETLQFVLDVMNCVGSPSSLVPEDEDTAQDAHLLPGGRGWSSIIRVRLLHAVARRRVRQKLARGQAYAETPDEVPISQEDMAATLALFSTAPMWAMKRQGLRLKPDHVRAYLALWKHIGYYLGVEPTILTHYFRSPESADNFLASIAVDLFSYDSPVDPRTIPTVSILRAVSDRPPRSASFEYHCALARYFAGDALAEHLGLPQTTLWMALQLRASLLGENLLVWLSQGYPRRAWAEKRRKVMEIWLVRSVQQGLGMRRSSFRPRTDIKSQPAEQIGGELADGVQAQEAVVPAFAGEKTFERILKELIFELVVMYSALALAIGVLMRLIMVTT